MDQGQIGTSEERVSESPTAIHSDPLANADGLVGAAIGPLETTPAAPDWASSYALTTPPPIAEPGRVVIFAPSVPWSTRHPVARRRFFPALSALLAVLVVASAAFAAVAVNDLNHNRSDLQSTQGQLANTKGELATTQGQLATTQSELADTQGQLVTTKGQLTGAQAQVTTLTGQVQRQTSCINALSANAAELNQIFGLQVANFNLTAEGSVWAKAFTGRINALNAALTDYFNAYKAAFNFQWATANSWITQGNAQVAGSNAQAAKMNAEVTKMNAATTAIAAAQSTFATHLAATQVTCGFGPAA